MPYTKGSVKIRPDILPWGDVFFCSPVILCCCMKEQPERLAGRLAGVGWQETMAIGSEGQRILVIGRSTPLIEGVSDLLQVVGYPVDMSSTWAATEYAMDDVPPDLVIVDLSLAASDGYRLAERIRCMPNWSTVPILFISFSGDDRIRELQQQWRHAIALLCPHATRYGWVAGQSQNLLCLNCAVLPSASRSMADAPSVKGGVFV
jgi:CheY-like chemotaxis protein